MSRNARREKEIKKTVQKKIVPSLEASKLLANILKTLDLTYNKDICMLQGKFVRVIPEKGALSQLKIQLENLDQALLKIENIDQQTVNIIRTARDELQKDQVVESKKRKIQAEKKVGALYTVSDNSTKVDLSVEKTESSEVNSDKITEKQPNPAFSEKKGKKIKAAELTELAQSKNKKRRYLTESGENSNDTISKNGSLSSPNTKKSKLYCNKIENVSPVKNPKSEFIVSQILSVATVQLQLFTEQEERNTDEEYLKKLYGVASYPTPVSKDLLPGEIPDMNFCRPKPTNQIQYSTFLSSVENFFRDFTDDDIKFLQKKFIIPQALQFQRQYDPEVTPYVIRKLGKLYTETWFKKDNNKNVPNITPPKVNDINSFLPKKSASDLNDEALEGETISCGPLLSRLLSAILKDTSSKSQQALKDEQLDEETQGENLVTEDETTSEVKDERTCNIADKPYNFDQNGNFTEDLKLQTQSASLLPQQQGWRVPSVNLDYPTFEERLKRELRYVGIISLPKDENGLDDPDWLNGREDDEVSTELREMQTILRQVTKRNEQRKRVLIPLIERQLAWQEYMSILDDLDKQVDQAYIKRIRVPRNKKKKGLSSSTVANQTSTSQAALQAAHQQAANSSLKSLLDKRQRWISTIGPLFNEPEKMRLITKESIFRDLDQDEEEEEADVFDRNRNNKDDEELGTESLQK